MNYEKFFLLKYLDLPVDIIGNLWKELCDDEKFLYYEGFVDDEYKNFIRFVTILVKTHLPKDKLDFYFSHERKFMIHYLFNNIIDYANLNNKDIGLVHINSTEAENKIIGLIRSELKNTKGDIEVEKAHIQILRIQSVIKRYNDPSRDDRYNFIRRIIYSHIYNQCYSRLEWIYQNATHNLCLNKFILIPKYNDTIFFRQHPRAKHAKNMWDMLYEEIIKMLPYLDN